MDEATGKNIAATKVMKEKLRRTVTMGAIAIRTVTKRQTTTNKNRKKKKRKTSPDNAGHTRL